MHQSRTLYTPVIGGYSTESDMMTLFEQLVDTFVEIEKQQFCVVDGKEYEIFIKVLVVADIMFLQKFTGHVGGCASTTHFCMFCSCISKFRHEGQPYRKWTRGTYRASSAPSSITPEPSTPPSAPPSMNWDQSRQHRRPMTWPNWIDSSSMCRRTATMASDTTHRT